MTAHQRFMELYGKKDTKNCVSTDIGKEYVCPTVGLPYTAKKSNKKTCMGTPVGNMGRVAYCDEAFSQQSGGSADNQAKVLSVVAYAPAGAEPVGYYMDFTETIGGRPVFRPYSQTTNVPAFDDVKKGTHFLDKQFDCLGPTWSERCL